MTRPRASTVAGCGWRPSARSCPPWSSAVARPRASPTPSSTSSSTPWGLLARALHLWEPDGVFGQVQNQAYGYLFPMGPVLRASAHLPRGARLGGAAALDGPACCCVAFLGVVGWPGPSACASATPAARLVGGLAYALAPRMLTVLGRQRRSRSCRWRWRRGCSCRWSRAPARGSPRRRPRCRRSRSSAPAASTRSATSAVLPLAVLWLLTRARGPRRRRRLTAWWPVVTLLAHAWWLVPLLLLGRYSPPFLDFIETGRITTIPTNLADVLRGTAHWVPYVDATSRAGSDLVRGSSSPSTALVLTRASPASRSSAPATARSSSLAWPPVSSWSPWGTSALRRAGSRPPSNRCSTERSRRCATSTSSTRWFGCRSCSGSPGSWTGWSSSLVTRALHGRSGQLPHAEQHRGLRRARGRDARLGRAPDSVRWLRGGPGLLGRGLGLACRRG